MDTTLSERSFHLGCSRKVAYFPLEFLNFTRAEGSHGVIEPKEEFIINVLSKTSHGELGGIDDSQGVRMGCSLEAVFLKITWC